MTVNIYNDTIEAHQIELHGIQEAIGSLLVSGYAPRFLDADLRI